MYFRQTLQLRAPCHAGVRVFEKTKILIFFSIIHVFFAFYAISNINKNGVQKNISGGGVDNLFL